jgi:hypothetical protein
MALLLESAKVLCLRVDLEGILMDLEGIYDCSGEINLAVALDQWFSSRAMSGYGGDGVLLASNW